MEIDTKEFKKNRQLTYTKAIIWILLVVTLQVVLVTLVSTFLLKDTSDMRKNLVSLLLSSLSIFMVAWLLYKRYNIFGQSWWMSELIKSVIPFRQFNFSFICPLLLLFPSVMLVGIGFGNVMVSFFGHIPTHYEVMVMPIIQVSKKAGWYGLVNAIFLVAVLPAIGEELFFRGNIQIALTNKYGSIKALMFTSLIFAILHMNFTYIPSIFFISIFLGYVFLKTGNLIYSILLHFFNNTVVVLIFRYDFSSSSNLEKVDHVNGIALLFALPLVGFLFYFLSRYENKQLSHGTVVNVNNHK